MIIFMMIWLKSKGGAAASGPSKPESSIILLGVGLGVGAMEEGPGLEDGLGVAALDGIGWLAGRMRAQDWRRWPA